MNVVSLVALSATYYNAFNRAATKFTLHCGYLNDLLVFGGIQPSRVHMSEIPLQYIRLPDISTAHLYSPRDVERNDIGGQGNLASVLYLISVAPWHTIPSQYSDSGLV